MCYCYMDTIKDIIIIFEKETMSTCSSTQVINRNHHLTELNFDDKPKSSNKQLSCLLNNIYQLTKFNAKSMAFIIEDPREDWMLSQLGLLFK